MVRWLPRLETPLDEACAIRVVDEGLEIELAGKHAAEIAGRLTDGERIVHVAPKACRVLLPLAMPLRGGRRLIIAGSRSSPQPNDTLVEALRRAHRMIGRDRAGLPIMEAAPESPYQRKLLRLAFLSPDIQHDIVAGRHPPALILEQLMQMTIPLGWKEQRETLGWPAAR